MVSMNSPEKGERKSSKNIDLLLCGGLELVAAFIVPMLMAGHDIRAFVSRKHGSKVRRERRA